MTCRMTAPGHDTYKDHPGRLGQSDMAQACEEARDILQGAFEEESAKEWYFGIRDALSVLDAALRDA